MRYQEWVNSEEYKKLTLITSFGDFIIAFVVYAIALILPIMEGYSRSQNKGAFIGLSIGTLIIILLHRLTILRDKFRPIEAFKSIAHLLKLEDLIYIFTFLLNFVIFFNIALSTVIWFSVLMDLYIISFLATSWINKRKSYRLNLFKRLTIGGFILSIFFTLNYYTSNTAWKETYRFNVYRQESSLIVFNKNELEDYIGIRLFNNIPANNGSPIAIKYCFEKGGLGLDVVKEYVFIVKPYY